MSGPGCTFRALLWGAAGLAGAIGSVACSLNLPDNIDSYNPGRGQEGRPDAPSSSLVTPTLPPVDGGALPIDGGGGGGTPDSSVVVPPAPLVCPPQPIGAFKPTNWIPPNAVHRNACTVQQASQLVDCVLTAASSTGTCASFMQSFGNDACINCGLTSSNAQRLGPILDDGRNFYTNTGGCIASMSGDASATGCGAMYEALLQCEAVACSKCVTDLDYGACSDAAAKDVCKAYAGALSCSSLYQTACLGTSPVDEANKLMKLYCLP